MAQLVQCQQWFVQSLEQFELSSSNFCQMY